MKILERPHKDTDPFFQAVRDLCMVAKAHGIDVARLRVEAMMDGRWWCQTHDREAAAQNGCFKASGILLPCHVVTRTTITR